LYYQNPDALLLELPLSNKTALSQLLLVENSRMTIAAEEEKPNSET
jgi:hypothetical protein